MGRPARQVCFRAVQCSYSHLVITPTKRTYGILRYFHGSITAGRGAIGDRITIKWEIGSTLVHHVTPANKRLRKNL